MQLDLFKAKSEVWECPRCGETFLRGSLDQLLHGFSWNLESSAKHNACKVLRKEAQDLLGG